jgi:uncharacterized protein (DUF983 family)
MKYVNIFIIYCLGEMQQVENMVITLLWFKEYPTKGFNISIQGI